MQDYKKYVIIYVIINKKKGEIMKKEYSEICEDFNPFEDNNSLEDKILSCLDEDQKKAVLAPLKNILCIASAGSGKTHMLTNRIAYHIAKGEPEHNFMLLTFTNKAAKEMTDRVKKVLDKEDTEILSGTFHHIAVIFLRKFGKAIGIEPNFEILTVDDAESLIKVCRENYIADNNIEKKEFPSKSIIYDFYSKRINLYMTYSDINEENYYYSEQVLEDIKNIIALYKEKKRAMNHLDFDDLLVCFYKLLKNENVRNSIADRYPNVFVDEYQDINYVQNQIIELLNKHNRLTVVGDDCQCIYTFRGSRFDYICNFVKNHQDAEMFQLKSNYRSTKNIVSMATQSINQNTNMIKKTMIAHKPDFKNPIIVSAYDEKYQSRYIVDSIRKYMNENPDNKYSDIAILVRANYLTRFIETELAYSSIPYRVHCGITFFERKHIKTMVAFAKFLYNKSDEVSFWKLMELIDGIGAKSAQKIFNQLKNDNQDLDFMVTYKVPKKADAAYKDFCSCLVKANKATSLEEQMTLFFSDFYKPYCKLNFEDYKERINDIEIMISGLYIYKDVQSFLDETSLNTEAYDTNETEEDKNNKVTISTIHKAKGLEWEKVILPYLSQEIFPRNADTLSEIEEERRLFYVAVTRAKKELDIISVENTIPKKMLAPSMYIEEIEHQLYDYKKIRY